MFQIICWDFNEFVEQNKLRCYYGGVGIDFSIINIVYQVCKIMDLEVKEWIVVVLVKMILDNFLMFINIGIIIEIIVWVLLEKKNLQVVINNLYVVFIFVVKEDFYVIIVGGEVCNWDGGIVGEVIWDFINQFKMDFGIIGISGIYSDGLLLDFDYCEVRVVQVIIVNFNQVLLVVDYIKFGCNVMV